MLFPWAKNKQHRQPECQKIIITFWVGSVAEQLDFAIDQLVDEDAKGAISHALACEISLLHWYLMDHELRRFRSDDPFFIQLSTLAMGSQWSYQQTPAMTVHLPDKTPLSREQWESFSNERVRAYEAISAQVEDDKTRVDYSNEKVNTYFALLAKQFWLCLKADMLLAGSNHLYCGKVDADSVNGPQEEQEDDFAASQASIYGLVLNVLMGHTLALYFTAQKWAQGGVVYDKTPAALQRFAQEAQEQAHQFRTDRIRGLSEVQSARWWEQHYRQNTHFTVAAYGDEYSEVLPGMKYRRIVPTSPSEGFPLHRFVLAAYDEQTGLVADDPETGTMVRLSLGRIICLLQTGSPLAQQAANYPDLNHIDQMALSPPSKWQVHYSTRRSIKAIYEAQGLAPRLGWLQENTGRTLLFAFCPNALTQQALLFAVPPTVLVAEESEPRIAQFAVLDHGINSQVVKPGYVMENGPPSDDWQSRIEKNEVFFRPANRCVYGPANLLYELFEIVDDQGPGYSLRHLALTCYDDTRCLAVLDPLVPERVAWYLSITEVAYFLQTGQLLPPESTKDEYGEPRIDPAYPPRPIDSLVMPLPSRIVLDWILKSVGGDGTGCVFSAVDGRVIVSLNSTGLDEVAQEAVRERLRYCIPPATPVTLLPLLPAFCYPLLD